jgi:hypothetical protein
MAYRIPNWKEWPGKIVGTKGKTSTEINLEQRIATL